MIDNSYFVNYGSGRREVDSLDNASCMLGNKSFAMHPRKGRITKIHTWQTILKTIKYPSRDYMVCQSSPSAHKAHKESPEKHKKASIDTLATTEELPALVAEKVLREKLNQGRKNE